MGTFHWTVCIYQFFIPYLNTLSDFIEMDKEFTQEWFDASSKAWKANKKQLDNCTYIYICKHPKRGGNCGRKTYKRQEYCWNHRKYFIDLGF